MALARTNLTLPEDLLAEVDSLAGPRGRSRYVAEAVAQRVKRDKLGKAIRETAGILVGTPCHMTPDEVTPGSISSGTRRPTDGALPPATPTCAASIMPIVTAHGSPRCSERLYARAPSSTPATS